MNDQIGRLTFASGFARAVAHLLAAEAKVATYYLSHAREAMS